MSENEQHRPPQEEYDDAVASIMHEEDHDGDEDGVLTAVVDGRVILDALPYVDPMNEDYELYALALIETEMQQMGGAPNPLSPQQQQQQDIPALRHAHRSHLFCEAVQQLNKRSNSQHDDNTSSLPDSSKQQQQQIGLSDGSFPVAPANGADAAAWEDAVRRAKIAYETQRLRALSLECQKDNSTDGAGSMLSMWNSYTNGVLQPQWEVAQQQLASQQEAVEHLNLARQQQQLETYGRPLRVRMDQYDELLQKLRLLKDAVARLEAEQQ